MSSKQPRAEKCAIAQQKTLLRAHACMVDCTGLYMKTWYMLSSPLCQYFGHYTE